MHAHAHSSIPGFYRLPLPDRFSRLSAAFDITSEQIQTLSTPDLSLDLHTANLMVENAIARFLIPIGLATNFIIDDKEVLIPMATDESGSIAGASLAAKLARPSGGFVTTCEPNICSGQIFFISSGPDSLTRLVNLSDSIRRIANEAMPGMTTRTGGTDSITLRQVDTDSGSLVVVELHVRVGD
jgi:degradative hydroxymethylglutaryl-CoA reductase